MRALIKTLLLCLMITQLHAQCQEQDYIALRALYLSTNGDNWGGNIGWLTKAEFLANPTMPAGTDVGAWYGVTTNENGCVTILDLNFNQLSGSLPPELGSMSSLTELILYWNQLSGSIPPELGNLSNLTNFFLIGNQLSGSLPPELSNLSNLTNLWLQDNQLSGSIPPELGQLSNLTHLDLLKNELSGNIPPELGNLSNLTYVSLALNQLSGNIPPELGNLSNLIDLSLYGNELTGSIPSELGSLSNLEHLWLFENQLIGNIPPELGNLSNLEYLQLQGNQLTGSIPSELGSLSNLAELFLSNNQLSGCYPPNLSNLCSQLNALSANEYISDNNNFDVSWEDFCDAGEGTCPSCQEQDYLALRALYLSTNGDNWLNNIGWLTEAEFMANPTIPAGTYLGTWYGVTTNENGCITHLELYNNQLSGSIPPELDQLGNLIVLRLSLNQLTGTIPPELGNLSNLTSLILYNNQLSGSIPPELGELGNLTHFRLSNNELSGSIPSELDQLSNLIVLRLHDNQLSGNIPTELGELGNLNYLHLANNQLGGNIPPDLVQLSNLIDLELSNNQLTGSIPTELGQLSNLKTLWLGYNELSGNIPPELGQLNNLEYLYLSDNALIGSIPSELGNLSNLIHLRLHNNNLSGCYDANLLNLCNQLNTGTNNYISDNNNFDAPWENFCSTGEGTCSSCQEQDYTALRALYLSTNGDNWLNNVGWLTEAEFMANPTIPAGTNVSTWYGVTTDDDGCVTCIDMDGIDNCGINLSAPGGNNLTGNIPPELEDLTHLTFLNLGVNEITGSIPPELGNLSDLIVLSLSSNHNLSGSIPNTLGNLTNLEILRLDFNNLIGSIPSELGNLTNLTSLLLRRNQLSGNIPPELGNLTNLTALNLGENQLTGNIPPEIGDLSNLEFLGVYSNQLSGCYDANLMNLCSQFVATYNNTSISNGNNFDATWEDFCSIGVAACGPCQEQDYFALRALYLSTDGNNWTNNDGWLDSLQFINNLTMPIGTDLGTWYGVMTDMDGCVSSLDLNNNHLNGSIPPEIENLNNLTYLDLSNNQLAGSIPVEIGDLSNLNELWLSNNQFIGDIPPELGDLSNLTNLRLHDNNFSGCYDANLSSLCTQLTNSTNQYISDGNNLGVSWEDFCSIGIDACADFCQERDYIALRALYLSTDGDNWTDNTGWFTEAEFIANPTMPAGTSVGTWYGVRTDGIGCVNCIDMDGLDDCETIFGNGNNLNGSLPPELGSLSNLRTLSLPSNELNGNIPSELGNLTNLIWLALNDNQLSGCYDVNLSGLCSQLNYSSFSGNTYISDGNNFDASWEDFCANGAGVCEMASLVLPGDCNNDFIVDGKDILYWGLAYDYTGPVRLNATTDWTPQPCSDWDNSVDEVNSKHQDTNGDGIVDTLDLEVIEANFGETYGNNPFEYNPTDAMLVVKELEIEDATNEVRFEVHIDSDTPINTHGISFTINPGTIINIDDVQIDINGSVLNPDAYHVYIDDNSNIHITLTRTDKMNQSIDGLVADLVVIVDDFQSLIIGDGYSMSATEELTAIGGSTSYSRLDGSVSLGVNHTYCGEKGTAKVYMAGASDYSWSTGETTSSIHNLDPGSYDITISDGMGATTIIPFDVTWAFTPLNIVIQNNEIHIDFEESPLAEEVEISLNGGDSYMPPTTTDVEYNLPNGTYEVLIRRIADECSTYLNSGVSAPQCHEQDYLALRALYLGTNGNNWTDNTGWLTEAEFMANPTMSAGTDLSTWYGVTTDTDGCVADLNLSNNNLSDNIPPELDNLGNLLYLNLQDNQLSGSIPSELGNLSNLIDLNLSNNELSGSIPSELSNLSNLIELLLSNNQLNGSVPLELGNLSNLIKLYLHQNELSGSIPSELGNLSNLESLILSYNNLSGNLPSELSNLSNLTLLEVNHNQLTCYTNNLSVLCTQLTSSYFNGNADISDGNDFCCTWEEFCMDECPTVCIDECSTVVEETPDELGAEVHSLGEAYYLIYELKKQGNVDIGLYNIHGQWLRTLHKATSGVGEYQIEIDKGDLPKGIYFIHVNFISNDGTIENEVFKLLI